MPERIGKVIKKLREERGLSQYDVESKSNGKLNRDWLASLETGRSKSIRDSEKVQILADVLGVSASDIYSLAGIIDIPSNLPPEDKEVLDLIHRMSGATRRIAIGVLRQLNGAESVTTEEEDAARAQKKAT